MFHFGNVVTKPWAENNLASYFFRIELHLHCEGMKQHSHRGSMKTDTVMAGGIPLPCNLLEEKAN